MPPCVDFYVTFHHQSAAPCAAQEVGTGVVPRQELDHRAILIALIRSNFAGRFMSSRTIRIREDEQEGHTASPGSRTLLPLLRVASRMAGVGPPQSEQFTV